MEKDFTGLVRMTVDSKGRVGIPAQFMAVLRNLCPEASAEVGLTITADYSIKIMPLPEYRREMEWLKSLNDQSEQERTIRVLKASFAERCPLDKQNRFKLNPAVMEFCSIGRQVVIIGNFQYMELWDENTWREALRHRMPRLGDASTSVIRKNEPQQPVQYLVPGPIEPVKAGPPTR